jgi:hypothetical protein
VCKNDGNILIDSKHFAPYTYQTKTLLNKKSSRTIDIDIYNTVKHNLSILSSITATFYGPSGPSSGSK